MLTLGIDLSSQPKDTAACLVEWHTDGRIVAREPVLHCTDTTLDQLIAQADAVGIDAPLGWPAAFVKAVTRWTATTWDDPTFQKNLRLRLTDIEVHRVTRLTPLSVSTDRIGLPAMRAMALLARHGATDRSGGGDGKFFEVYPAGSLHQWGLTSRGYKGTDHLAARHKLLAALRKNLPSLQAAGSVFSATDHALDALLASLTTRCAATGSTLGCPAAHHPVARHEGWIHLPQSGVFPA
jgi:predicted nuclease with RNAse H fold